RQLRGLHGLALLLLALPLVTNADADCPCEEPTLCRPIRHHPDHEVFVFDVGYKTWKYYDWSQITTLAAFGKYDSELMCYAHSKGARVVLKGDVSVKDIIDPSFRASWIAQKLILAKKQYMDGINIDIEQEVNCSSPEYDALTALVKETTDAFHREIEGSQVTFDVAWSPKNIDKRCYNYTGIADACDFVFVMSYDEQSQVWSDCIAAANAPYNQTLTGYLDLYSRNVNKDLIVLIIVYYTFGGSLLNFVQKGYCTIAKVPFRGACSDAAGRQVPYKVIMKQINSSISGGQWNEDQQAPYYNYK
uniref:Di-N-acetylchitobiase n=1 Tax=Loxodonta africana TaxID=9785 RepID=G3T830_LOXAF